MFKKSILVLLFAAKGLFSAQNFTPANTIISSDLDGVLISTPSSWTLVKLIYDGITYNPFNGLTYLSAMYHAGKTYPKDVNGLTFLLLFQGMRDNNLLPYVDVMLNTIESSRRFITGTEKIYRYLKDKKGYTIVFATNNDRIAYEISAQSLGQDLTSLAEYVFVAQPGNSDKTISQLQTFADQPTTPENYKKLLSTALTIKPTDIILHAPDRKPDGAYYDYIEEFLGANKNIIFIDDKKENVDGFCNRPNKTNIYRYGIQFKNPEQLADEFIGLGILSETDDQELLNEIRYPGFIGKLQLGAQKIVAYVVA